ncbi:MAG: agglutinin biogenesis protein MshI [Burkholderiaceae bacterium]|nr:agglutinin biogenesis protein MshI [Burkholderiaceae bacterium]
MGLFRKDAKLAGWLSIVLGDEGIRAAHINRTASGAPVVEWVANFPLIKSAGDKPLDRLAKESHANRYSCTTLLAPSEYQLVSVEAPTVPAEELKTAIRWRLKDMLDFHVDDATIDVLDVPVDKDAPVRSRSMYAVAARNQVIQQRQQMFENAKIELKAIDIPDLAQRNISALLEPPGRGLAMLSFDEHGGLLTVTYKTELYLARRIDVSLPQLTAAAGDQKAALYDKITLELQRSLDHFDRQYHFITVGKLLLTPMGEENAPLQASLKENLYTPVDSFDLADSLDFSKVPELKTPAMQQHYFSALGAALRLEETVL